MPKKNRLQLDFSLPTAEERQTFLTKYLETLTFTPTSSELELMANYVLWGDKNSDEAVELETYWKKKGKKIESLDELKENPAFLETRLTSPLTMPKTIKTRRVFSREEARSLASPYVLAQLEALWREIDELDLEIRLYENFIGRQAKPPRDALVERFTPDQIEEVRAHAQQLTEYAYLKKRKLLVEKRSEQYQWRDTYASPLIQRHTIDQPQTPTPPPLFNSESPVLPLGTRSQSLFSQKLFPSSGEFPNPSLFSEEDQRQLSKLLWAPTPDSSLPYFNFAEPAHLYALVHTYLEIAPDATDENLRALFSTFTYYRKLTKLPPIYDTLLSLKLARKTNEQIVEALTAQYGKTYGDNYISTLFRQKILPRIAETVRAHHEAAKEIFFPENFKVCKDCKRVLLRNPDNFMRKAKSADGFSPRCKACDKVLRDQRREKEK